MKTVNDASLTISFPSDVEMLTTRTLAYLVPMATATAAHGLMPVAVATSQS